MPELHPVLADWNKKGLRWSEAVLVRAHHSAPLPPGARLYVNESGDMHGAISMGCVESDIREHLLNLLAGGEPRIVHYGSSDAMILEVGLTCGGEIDVLLRLPSAESSDERPTLRITRMEPAPVGGQLMRFADGRWAGTLGSAELDRLAEEEAPSLCPKGGQILHTMAGVRVFIEYPEPPPTLVIVGASPIGVALCRMAAMAGFRVVVVDPRRQYASAERFPEAERVVHAWPEEGLKQAGLDASWYVAVLAHDAKLDLPALVTALRMRCTYIGLLGSRRTQEKYRTQLAEQGFPPAETDHIHGPIGLSIGALEPAEIAVSILAELIAIRRGRANAT